MALVEVPGIDITGELTGTIGKICKVKLPEKRKKFVDVKMQALKDKGEIIADSRAYQVAYNTNIPGNEIGGLRLHAVTKNNQVLAYQEFYKRSIGTELSPETYAKELALAVTQEQGKNKVPGLDLAAKVLGLIGADTSQNQTQNNTLINFFVDKGETRK